MSFERVFEDKDSLKAYNWTDIKYSPIKLDPRMLLEQGYTVRRKCFLRNENHCQDMPSMRYVTYDRAFVIYHLVSQLKAFSGISEDNFKLLMEEVFYELFFSDSNKGNATDGDTLSE